MGGRRTSPRGCRHLSSHAHPPTTVGLGPGKAPGLEVTSRATLPGYTSVHVRATFVCVASCSSPCAMTRSMQSCHDATSVVLWTLCPHHLRLRARPHVNTHELHYGASASSRSPCRCRGSQPGARGCTSRGRRLWLLADGGELGHVPWRQHDVDKAIHRHTCTTAAIIRGCR